MKKTDVMTAEEAAKYMRVSLFTLHRMDEKLRPAKLTGGHRRYRRRWLNKYYEESKGDKN